MNPELVLTFHVHDNYLEVSYIGEHHPAILLEMMLKVKEKAKEVNHTRILLDCLQLPAPANDLQRLYVGLDIASMFPYPLRVAALYPPEFTTYLAQDVAIYRGTFFRVFAQSETALAWLLHSAI